ncbi:MAG TPA: Ig-like domain-containing protein [Actinophytocola sp.]|uniref:Ig-like domain-containing protein n=1 Tax=Actinophytocola sp. TaxID=1872138 RepID=UPI002DDD5813|nr:Ig-like domain-containing protein [Actinophytocola sp.]HEV2779195.1 Ig-like domain-containing protein [Actinophytocola sp.]
MVALTACSSTEAGTATGPGGAPVQDPPRAKITAVPAVDAKDVSVVDPIKITVTDGTLTEVKVTNEEGKEVGGQLAPDKLSWTSTEALGYAKTYTYDAKATGSDNKTAELKGTFTTVKPAKTIRATINPVDNATVGVGMPISLKFDSPPKDRAAVQKALTVTTSKGEVEGSWAWLSDAQVDYRPKAYWPANITVTVTAKLYGVAYGNGGYGKADLSTKFSIGRNQVTKIHTPDHQMVVFRDGKQVAVYPTSNGEDADPNLNTPNGTLIIMTREPIGDFSNPRYGYTNVKKKWSLRISNHGEYIHENEENHANIGKRNTSHGCVNMYEADAKAYFDSALIGDPVEITGSQADMPTTSDVNDWLFSWDKWKSMSAL